MVVDESRAAKLCDNLFYSAANHQAAFCLPCIAQKELEKPPPTLGETTAELTSILDTLEKDESEEDESAWNDGGYWSAEVPKAMSN